MLEVGFHLFCSCTCSQPCRPTCPSWWVW